MTTSMSSRTLRAACLIAIIGVAPAALAAESSVMFASDFHTYAGATHSPYIHSLQSGDLIGFNSASYTFSFSSSATNIAYDDYYTLQFAAGTTFANASTDYFGMTIQSPLSHGATAAVPLPITNASNLIIRMGNIITPNATAKNGQAKVFTLELNNANQQNLNATAICDVNVTLNSVGPNSTYVLGGVTQTTQNGLWTYTIPLSSFTCSKGSITTLKTTGVTDVAIKILGNENPGVKHATNGGLDAMAVSYIAFQ